MGDWSIKHSSTHAVKCDPQLITHRNAHFLQEMCTFSKLWGFLFFVSVVFLILRINCQTRKAREKIKFIKICSHLIKLSKIKE